MCNLIWFIMIVLYDNVYSVFRNHAWLNLLVNSCETNKALLPREMKSYLLAATANDRLLCSLLQVVFPVVALMFYLDNIVMIIIAVCCLILNESVCLFPMGGIPVKLF